MKKFIAIPLIFCLLILCSCSNYKTSKKQCYDSNGMPYESITITGPGTFKDKDFNIRHDSMGEGTTIEHIEARAFLQNNKIESVDIYCVDIGDNAFSECANLKSVAISYSDIGSNAFYNCDNLESVTIGSTCDIGEGAFSACYSLKNLTIQGGIIGKHAFSYCDQLTSITIQGSKIEGYAFAYCDNLENVTITSAYSIDPDAFFNCNKHITINYLKTKEDFKHTAQNGYRSGLSTVFGGGITVICSDGNLYY